MRRIKRSFINYRWLIVFTGVLCVFASLGFGRFALGMLLPSMGSALHLTYSQMGFISTANFLGYLISVLLCGILTRKLGTRILIFLALLLVGFSMGLVSMADSFLVVMILYLLTGIGSGASNVPIMALVSVWFDRPQRGKAAGFIVIGSGFAIILAGKLIPFLNVMSGPEGWRMSWLVLGAIVIIVSFFCLAILRNRPEEVGLVSFGGSVSESSPMKPSIRERLRVYREVVVYHMGAIYFLFGYTYVIYTTFIVTFLVQERGFSEAVAGNFWSWVGFLSLLSGPVFGTLSDKLGRRAGLITVFSIQMLSYLLIASKLPGVILYLSIFFFGIVAWSIPSIMAAIVGDYVGPTRTAEVFGFITFIFGLGQIAGPAVAGMLAELTDSFYNGFSMAAGFAGLAIVLTIFLRYRSSQ